MSKKHRILVIGSGFSGLSAATHLAKAGNEVIILEKNSSAGGRARSFTDEGFTFDMGPSWYWMPDIFESYFNDFDKKVSDFYTLKRLDPSYRIVFSKEDEVDVPAQMPDIYNLYEKLEPGSSKHLKNFLEESEYKYKIGIGEFVNKPSLSIREYFNWKVIKAGFKLHMFSSFESYTKRFFKSPFILQMLEFPVLFLGGTAKSTPALYSLMNYSDMIQGTWYPEGGMYKVVGAMENLAKDLNVKIIYNSPVTSLKINKKKIVSVLAGSTEYNVDYVVASGDYRHVEQELLPVESRKYSQRYWEKRVLSPSSIIFYLGFSTKIPELQHHTLLFDEDFKLHASSIYENPRWPENPSIYISCTSKSDDSVAPEGHENLMILIPVAPGLIDTEEIRQKYFEHVLMRLERYTGRKLKDNLIYSKIYSQRDFISDYNAFKGNAYGLANTLMQTAFLKPSMLNRKVKNLVYTGQLTVPGPGVPPAIISGKMAATLIDKLINKGEV